MTFDEYCKLASRYANYPQGDPGLYYVTMGLCGESGEYAEVIKRYLREGHLDTHRALKEIGDVLWYLARCAHHLGSSLDEVASQNLRKLEDRVQRGVIHGEGDDR